MRIKVASKDMGAKENGAQVRIALSIPLHVQELDYEKGVYELKDYVGEQALNLNLLPKLGLANKTLPTSFPNRLLENT